jgi:hypothetical protein
MEYKIYQSNIITSNLEGFKKQCFLAKKIFEQKYNKKLITIEYPNYNVFCLTSNSILFYNLFQELNFHIRSFIGDNRPLWLQSWLNIHKENELKNQLKDHYHDADYHGYISIDPKTTTTIFKNYKIENKIGQIYIGPGGEKFKHYVKINESFQGNRITLGFDVQTNKNTISSISNIGFIPLI